MILLFDIGNTHTHVGLADNRRVRKQTNIPTAGWFDATTHKEIGRFVSRAAIEGVALCSVVPRATAFAPGLSAMTDYLHEKTALLPRIKIREVKAIIGKNTEQAMLIGAVHGYRGLIRGLLTELKRELGSKRLPVVATGGYARLIAAGMPEIAAIDPLLTLEGLRLVWVAWNKLKSASVN